MLPAVRASRRVVVKTDQKAVRVQLLHSLAVCGYCGRRFRIQTLKNYPTYYREDSHLRGYYDSLYSGQNIHAEKPDEQVATLVKSLKLTFTWKRDVRKLLLTNRVDPTRRSDARKNARIWRV